MTRSVFRWLYIIFVIDHPRELALETGEAETVQEFVTRREMAQVKEEFERRLARVEGLVSAFESAAEARRREQEWERAQEGVRR